MKTRILLSHRARRVFVWLHLWLGLVLGAWFSLIGITGSILTWRTELGAAELSRRFPVSKPADNAALISLSQATSALQKSLPDLKTSDLGAVAIPSARSSFYSFTLGRNRRTARQVLVDPYSAQILGTVAPRSGIVATIQQFHQRLIAGVRGYVFNGFLTVLAIPLLLSGLWLWWPTKIAQLKARLNVKRDAPLHRKIYDWHNILGIYLYSLLLITTVTGALLVKNHLDRDGWAKTWEEVRNGEAPPQREGRRPETRRGEAGRGEGAPRRASGANSPQAAAQAPGNDAPTVTPQGERLGVDALLQRARQAVPRYEITRVSLPQTPEAAWSANYSLATGFATNRNLFLDPYTGAVLKSDEPSVGSNQIVRGLHLGDFGGVGIKIIYTLTGLMPLGLFGSGLWLWARKKWKKRTTRGNAAPTVASAA